VPAGSNASKRPNGSASRELLHPIFSQVLLTLFSDSYEESIIALMTDWSEHPSEPLTELEVFVGFILNRTGVQTNRQRDRSLKLKDDFDRVVTSIVREFRKASTGSLGGRLQTVELCLAGIHIGRGPNSRREHRWSRKAGWHIESFKIVAASALMRELNSFANEHRNDIRGGGFPGVQGLPVRTITAMDHRPVNSTLLRHQTAEPSGAENQRRATPGSGPVPQLTQEAMVTHNLLTLINSRYPTQPGK
jgi:hypothetical protein